MNNDDFWTRLASAPFSDEAITSAIDTHLSGKAHGEAFEGVRALTDKMRAAGALSLPVEAGTKVLFAGNLGAYLSYDEIPTEGSVGEVVTVKSANGDITHHDGKVFVKWDDGKFLGIHAEHLRLAGTSKKASDLKKQFEKVKALAEKKPDNKFLKGLLEQMADEGFTPTDKQMKVVKDIEGEVKQQAEMKKELKGLKDKKAALPLRGRNREYPPIPGMEGPFRFKDGLILYYDPKEGEYYDRKTDMYLYGRGPGSKSGVKPLPGQRKSAFAGGHIDAEILHRAHAAGRKARSMPMTYGNMDMAAAAHLERYVPRHLWGDAEVAFINGWMGRNHRRASFQFRKAHGIGDLREFLGNRFGKTADGKLIHKSTNDLWSITADGDNYTVARLFDDEGHPLKG
jgi:hypothetical protein